MKIGLLTFHRAHNYGAVLQCYALQEVLKDLGHDVWVIDYRQKYIEGTFKPFNWMIFLNRFKHPRAVFRYIISYSQRRKNYIYRKTHYENFLSKYINLTSSCSKNIPSDFEYYIIGSDQVWSEYTGKLDPIYLGNFKHKNNSHIISYAISTNIKTLDSIINDYRNNFLGNFTHLSFREKKYSMYLKEKTGLKTRSDIDPTLLASKEYWEQVIQKNNQNEKYILLYQVRYKDNDKSILYNKAKILAEKLNIKVIDILEDYYSVEEFVSLFKYAECIITSSFHAVAFSLIFNKPLYVYVLNDGRDERYVNILNSVNALEALVSLDFTPTEINKKIDYEIVNKNLEILRNESLNYLKDVII